MSLYGCVPAAYFPAHPSLTYWPAGLAGLASTPEDAAIASAALGLNLKKSSHVLPLSLADVIHKTRSAASLRTGNDDTPSSFRVTNSTSRNSSSPTPSHLPPPTHRTNANNSDPPSPAVIARFAAQAHQHLELQALQVARLHQHHQDTQRHNSSSFHGRPHPHPSAHHRPFSATPPPVGNGLAPLQALCDSDVSAFAGGGRGQSGNSPGSSITSLSEGGRRGGLKFGMSRILSEDFGKAKSEKEPAGFQLSNVPEACRSLPLCPCNSPTCTAYAPRDMSPYPHPASLSAVHALQPPSYPVSGAVDGLPGPYSILSADHNAANQPKRKRSWSRAVFSNLQRKGLEKRFEVQKYVTKPDRRQLAAMLGLTDAQVKVWFQNRRMKWRHAQQQGEKDKQNDQQKSDESMTCDDVRHEDDLDPHSGPDSPKPMDDSMQEDAELSDDIGDSTEVNLELEEECTPVSQSRSGENSTSQMSLETKSNDNVTSSLVNRIDLSKVTCSDVDESNVDRQVQGNPMHGQVRQAIVNRSDFKFNRFSEPATLKNYSLYQSTPPSALSTIHQQRGRDIPPPLGVKDKNIESNGIDDVTSEMCPHPRPTDDSGADSSCTGPVADKAGFRPNECESFSPYPASVKTTGNDSEHFVDENSCEIDVSN